MTFSQKVTVAGTLIVELFFVLFRPVWMATKTDIGAGEILSGVGAPEMIDWQFSVAFIGGGLPREWVTREGTYVLMKQLLRARVRGSVLDFVT